jgi:hypothetical protein
MTHGAQVSILVTFSDRDPSKKKNSQSEPDKNPDNQRWNNQPKKGLSILTSLKGITIIERPTLRLPILGMTNPICHSENCF